MKIETCDYLQRFCPGGTIAGHLLQKYWQIITKIQVDYPTNHCQLRTGGRNTRCTRDEFDTQILNLMDNFEKLFYQMDFSLKETRHAESLM